MTIESRLRAASPPVIDLAALAEREGLLDVAVATVGTPVGDLIVAATPAGLVRTSWFGEEVTLQELADKVSPRVVEAPAKLDPVRRQLDEYFDGRRRQFDVTIDWLLVGDWARKVLAATARIPFGEYRSYGEVAAEAGSPKAFRAAGTALGHNPVPVVVPCHRVLPAGARTIGSYTGGAHIKEHLLRLEGVLGT
jgi:methylated-DNA-[protein]-cysteine S-methyltransferase